jgi:hypothetical protein
MMTPAHLVRRQVFRSARQGTRVFDDAGDGQQVAVPIEAHHERRSVAAEPAMALRYGRPGATLRTRMVPRYDPAITSGKPITIPIVSGSCKTSAPNTMATAGFT